MYIVLYKSENHKIMKKIISSLFLMAMMMTSANAQNIKTVAADWGDDFAAKLGDDRYDIDSLVITGNLDHMAFPVIVDCVRNGKLTGIDMSKCTVEDDSIPDNGLMVSLHAHLVDEHCIKGLTLPQNLRAVGDHGLGHLHVNTLNLPSTLRIIDNKAFDFCQHVRGTLVIPEGVETLGREAFYDWYSIESVTFPKSLRKIGYMTFSGLTSVKELNLNDGLEEIGEAAFERGLYDVKEIRIPESVTSIGKSAFYGEKYLDLVVLPPSLNTLKESVFGDCSVKEIVWPYNLETMESHSIDDFTGSSLFLPEGLKDIKDNVLQYVDNATTILLPSSLESIGGNVFGRTPSLKSLYAKNPIPPVLPVNVGQDEKLWFNNLPADAVLYVPVGSAAAYRDCVAFSKFSKIVETADFPTSIDEVKTTVGVNADTIYSLDGRLAGKNLKSLEKGIYIVKGRKITR